MTPEEERQNRALLDSYDPEAEAEPMPGVLPGYYQDLAEQGRQDLNRPEPARPAVTQVRAPAPTPEPAGPQYTDETIGSVLAHALEPLGGLVKSYGAYRVAKNANHSPYGAQAIPAVQGLAESGNRAIEQAARAQEQRDSVRKAGQRQAWLDKNAATDRSRRMAREDVEDQFSLEARDPNSDKSKRLRDEIRTAFPQFAEAMPEFDTMSVYDFAHTPHPGLDKAKFDAQTERLKDIQGTRGQQAVDVTRLRGQQAQDLEQTKIAGRVKLKAVPKAGGAGGTGGAGSEPDLSEYEQALAKEFGGADKVPPTLLAQLHAAGKNPDAKQRATGLRTVMQNAHGQNVGGQKQATAETKAYGKEAEPALATIAWTRNLRKELHAAGIDPDHYKGEDIPGYGRLKSFVPDAALSAAGQRMRSAVGGEVAGLILSMSGKASSEQEARRLQAVAGAMKGGSPENLIWGMHQLEDIAKAQLARAQANNARGAAHEAGAGPIRVRTPDGKTHRFAGTAEEAQKAGYEVIQ